MFWRKKKDKFYETFEKNKAETTRKIEYLEEQIDRHNQYIDKLYTENQSIKQILRNYVPGEIHGISHQIKERWVTKYKTYLYVEGFEYIFENLRLYNPSFTRGIQNNVIYVTDKDDEEHYNSYILDTETCAYIQTRKE